jgi:uncharacterized membrane protein
MVEASLSKNRIESIDLLKGLVMVIMALDHVRDYFHAPAFMFDPTDPAVTTLPIFFTRWITNFCAPVFSFLAGLSAFFVGRRKDTKELSGFLLKRGLWLIFLELTIINFAWYFDITFQTPGLLVLWALGIAMVTLSGLVFLPTKVIVIFSCVVIFGHNLLDPVHFEGNAFWAMLHDQRIFFLSDHYKIYIFYPIIPWIAVMSLGYCFGELYTPSFEPARRKKILNRLGVSTIALFVILRGIDVYGDPGHWSSYPTVMQTAMSMLATSKYPPSLFYLLMTLGPAFLFLANSENLKGRVVGFFSIFGRVPFFYYILHLYLIHLFALIAAELTGFGWREMILSDWVGFVPGLKGYGFSLSFVYLIWITVVVLLYPLCKKFDVYKMNNKEKWWLSYL